MSEPYKTPTRIDRYSDQELLVAWNTGEEFSIPYLELRFACPCAGCVDERSGQRTLKKESLDPLVKPASVATVGNYALNIRWSDQHGTGMYHYDRLYDLCGVLGRSLKKKPTSMPTTGPTFG